MGNDDFPQEREKLIAEIVRLRAEAKFYTHGRNISAAIDVSKQLIRYGAIVWVFYYIYLSISALAGHTTVADFGVTFLGSLTVSQGAAWLLAFVSTLYGLNERRIRKNTVAKFQPRITELERLLDPGRSTSTLTLRGDTNPEDL